MNSKTLFDYLPADVADELKQYENNMRGYIEHVFKIGPEPIFKFIGTRLSHDEIMTVLNELKNNPDPMLYFITDHFISMCNIISLSYLELPGNDGKTISELFGESKKHPERDKEIQSMVNNDRKLKRLIMNEYFLDENNKTFDLLQKRISENEAFKPIIDRFKTFNFISELAVLCQLNRQDDFIVFCENAYHETIKQYTKEHKLTVSGKEWDYGKTTVYFTKKQIKERLKEQRHPTIIPIPQNGLLGITDKKYKHALSLYTKSKGMGLITDKPKKSILEERIEVNLILVLFTAIYAFLESKYETKEIPSKEMIPSKFTVNVDEISTYLKSNKSNTARTEKFEHIKEMMEFTESDTKGILNENGEQSLMKVLDEVESDKGMNTITFKAPLLSHIITSMLESRQKTALGKLSRRDKKEKKKAEDEGREPKESRFYDGDFIAVVEYLEKPSLPIQRDADAVAIVREILQWVKSANLFEKKPVKASKRKHHKITLVDGTEDTEIITYPDKMELSYWELAKKGKYSNEDKNNKIMYSTLIDRVPTFKYKLENSKNLTDLLTQTFTHVWQYLNDDTTFKEDYPYLKFPGCNLPEIDKMDKKQAKEWIPKVKTKNSLYLVLEPISKEEQIKQQIEKSVKEQH